MELGDPAQRRDHQKGVGQREQGIAEPLTHIDNHGRYGGI